MEDGVRSIGDVNVCVAVRCRPSTDEEQACGGDGALVCPEASSTVIFRRQNGEQHKFVFDHVFDQKATQEEVFRTLGEPQVEKSLYGYNSTIFAYGHTGTGKTYTILNANAAQPQQRGLFPRMTEGMFQTMAKSTAATSSREFLVQASFIEVYNEGVYDLLQLKSSSRHGRGLDIKEHKGVGIFMNGLTEVVVEDSNRLLQLSAEALKQRVTASTAVNSVSSRSHYIVALKVHCKDSLDPLNSATSKVNMVDLAGCERTKASEHAADRATEGANINKSLSALGNVIKALSMLAEGATTRTFVPYRDSKLTRILQESFGGNSFCTMIATVSPASMAAEDTLDTLNYARRAKAIKQSISRNEDSRRMKQLEAEVTKLKTKLEDESVPELESRYRSQIETLEGVMKQTWTDKQQLSEQFEKARRKAQEEAAQAAEVARLEKERKLTMLEEHGDLWLTAQAACAVAGETSTSWSVQVSALLALQKQLESQLRAVQLYRESASTDFATIWRLRGRQVVVSFKSEELASALTLLGQVKRKLTTLLSELEALAIIGDSLLGQECKVAPEVAVAVAQAVEVETSDETSADDAKELTKLLELLEQQVRVSHQATYAKLLEEVQSTTLVGELSKLARCLGEEDDEGDSEGSREASPEHSGGEMTRKASHGMCKERSALLTDLMLACSGVATPTSKASKVLPSGPPEPPPARAEWQPPELIGLCTGAVPDDALEASSNQLAKASGRLLQAGAFGGWCAGRDQCGEFLEVNVADVGDGPRIITGICIQGRAPCSGEWRQTYLLLREVFAGEDRHRNLKAWMFERPPVRLVHDLVVTMLRMQMHPDIQQRLTSLLAEGEPWENMARANRCRFFDDTIEFVSNHSGEVSGVSCGEDILRGQNCVGTNCFLQALGYLTLAMLLKRKNIEVGGLVATGHQWTIAFKLQHFANGYGWRWYGGNSEAEALVFEGNSDANTVAFRPLLRACEAKKLRILPTEWCRHPSLRVEVYAAAAGATPGAEMLGIPSLISELKANASLTCRAVAQLHADLEARRSREAASQNDERQGAERKMQEALAKIDLLQAKLEESEAAVLASRAEAERLRAQVPPPAKEVTTLAIVPVSDSAASSSEDRKRARQQSSVTELQRCIDDLRQQFDVVTDERDAARMNEEELFYALASAEQDSREVRKTLDATITRMQGREGQLFQTLNLMDPGWSIRDMDAAEELLFTGAFFNFTCGYMEAGLDDEDLQKFILSNTTITKSDIDTGLAGLDVLDEACRMDLRSFLRLLRERPCREEDGLRHFMDLAAHSSSQVGDELSAQACRDGVLGILASLCGDSLPQEQAVAAADVVMTTGAGKGASVSLEQWLVYWKISCRLGRLWRWAYANGVGLSSQRLHVHRSHSHHGTLNHRAPSHGQASHRSHASPVRRTQSHSHP